MDGLTLQQLDQLRRWIENEMVKAQQARNSSVSLARWRAMNDVLIRLDEMLADVVTVTLVDYQEAA